MTAGVPREIDEFAYLIEEEVPPFPFAAILNQPAMQEAVPLAVISPEVRFLLIAGEPGTGKRTCVRGIHPLLPIIDAVSGCPGHCRVDGAHCTRCDSRAKSSNLVELEYPIPFVEIGPLTPSDVFFGTIDPDPRLDLADSALHGVLARANRGILFVPRIDMMDHQMLEQILEASRAGNYGLRSPKGAFSFPTNVTLIGTIETGPGEVPDHLVKAASLIAFTSRIEDLEERIEITKRMKGYARDRAAFLELYAIEERRVQRRLSRAGEILGKIGIPRRLEDSCRDLLRGLEIDTRRFNRRVLQAARAHAAWAGRTFMVKEDIAEVIELVTGESYRQGQESG